MMQSYLAEGIGWGVRLFAAGATLIILTAVFAGIGAAIMAFVKGDDDEQRL